MSEIIADIPFSVVDAQGLEFYVSVAGERRPDGEWEGWLEYVPLNDSDVRVTETETTQSSRAILERWAETLTETYVQGAFYRATPATADTTVGRVVAQRTLLADVAIEKVDLPDPFELLRAGHETMRARLSVLPRRALFEIIAVFGLNPAGKNLAWLNDRQLVTFIVTATEVQNLRGRRAR
jgi:hypothetical protein